MSENPITERITQVHAQWVDFAENSQARLLVWEVAPQELAIIEAFIARESDERAAETDDVFLRLVSPFATPHAHGYQLREELVSHYHEAKPLFDAEGIEASWACPAAREADDDVCTFIGALLSLRAAHVKSDQAHLVIWLDPGNVSAPEKYLLWLQRLLFEAPTELRFIAVDARDEGAYAPLHKADPARVHTEPCNLDMPAAVVALAESANKDTPGGQFRVLLTKLGQATAAGELSTAAPLAKLAVDLALAQGWPHLAAVVHMMIGGAYSALGQPLEAAKAYTEAERLAAECEKRAASDAAQQAPQPDRQGKPDEGAPQDDLLTYGRQLRLQARFGQGATMIAYSAWKQAAEVYLNAAPIAASLNDARAELDCFRLASVCSDQNGEIEKAWDLGMRGFNVGLAMDEETRTTSTMAYLCDHLERFTKKLAAYRAHHGPLLEHFEKLLGPDWRPKPIGSTGVA